MNNKFFLIAALLAGAGLIAGLLLSRAPASKVSTPNAPAAASQAAAPSQPVSAESHQGVGPGPEATVAAVPVSQSPGPYQSMLNTLALPTDFLQTEALYALLGRADLTTVKAYIEEAKTIQHDGDRDAGLAIIYSRFADLDPDGLIAHLYASDIPNKDNIIYSTFHSWAKYDLEAAVARIDQLRAGRDQQIAARAILQARAGEGPELLRELAGRLPGGLNPESYAVRGLLERSRTDPEAAMRAALALTDSGLRQQAIARIAAIWSEMDYRTALAFARHIPDVETRRQFRRSVLNHIAQNDPETILAMLADPKRDGDWRAVLYTAMQSLAVQNPEKGLALIEDLPSADLKQQALHYLMSQWAGTDPRAAAAAYQSLSNPGLQRMISHTVGEAYARLAPMEALRWAEKLAGRQSELWRSVMSTIAQTDPHRALELLGDPEPTPHHAELFASILAAMARTDPLAAADYIDALPPGALRRRAAQQALQSWAEQDPEGALAWLLNQPASLQMDMVWSIAHQFAQGGLQTALGMVDGFDSEVVRDQWISALIGQYAGEAPFEAADWINRFRDNPHYGEWLSTIAQQVAGSDPRAAIDMLAAITNREQYRMALNIVASQWAGYDPAAAARWVAGIADADGDLIQSVAAQWYQYDPAAAERWVLGLREAHQRDAGILSLLNGALYDIVGAERLLHQIQSPDTRFQGLTRMIYQLARYNPAEARALADRTDLSPERRRQVDETITRIQQGG